VPLRTTCFSGRGVSFDQWFWRAVSVRSVRGHLRWYTAQRNSISRASAPTAFSCFTTPARREVSAFVETGPTNAVNASQTSSR
jgi:hypothetical protein